MFEMLWCEGEYFVNLCMGKKFEWGDMWMYEWGGGVGIGRSEFRSRWFMVDGAVEVMLVKGDVGYVFVLMSLDK